MADFLKHTFKQKGTKPTRTEVDPHGVSEAKPGGGSKQTMPSVDLVPAGSSPMGKKGTGGTMELGKIKSMAAENITSSAIDESK